MHIALFSKADASGGGASRVATDLDRLINTDGRSSAQHWAGMRHPALPTRSLREGWLADTSFALSRQVSRRLGLADFLTSDRLGLPRHEIQRADVVHIHDISDAISPFTVRHFARRKPTVWTLHDCSPFTGGCIYPGDCSAYVGADCHACPQLAQWPLKTRFDHTHWMQRYKLKLINENLRLLICPSAWIAGMAANAGVSESLLRIVPNGVDIELFRPTPDVSAEREATAAAPLRILLSAMDLSNRFKGAAIAIEAINQLPTKAEVIVMGRNSDRVKQKLSGLHTVVDVGLVSQQARMAGVYASADVFLFPSLEDNCPLAALESMASGTPLIGFARGGLAELVSHGNSGWLAQDPSPKGLLEGLRQVTTQPSTLQRWSVAARQTAVERFDQRIFLDRHLALYQEAAGQ